MLLYRNTEKIFKNGGFNMQVIMFANPISPENEKASTEIMWFPDIIYVEKNPPPRPDFLAKIKSSPDVPINELIINLLQNKKSVAYGGTSLKGCNLIYVVGLLKREGQELKGWLLNLGDPEKEEQNFLHINTQKNPSIENPFPNQTIFFVSEIKKEILEGDVDRKKLLHVAQFILPFANCKGPPKGIDW